MNPFFDSPSNPEKLNSPIRLEIVEVDETSCLKQGQSTPQVSASQRINHYFTSTTFHGFDQIFATKAKCSKLFWFTIMIGVFAITGIQLVSLVRYFIKNPTLTSIGVGYPKAGLELPTLTFCTLSKLNRTAVYDKYPNMNQTLAEYSTSSFISAYSTALMDLGYFKRMGWNMSVLENVFLKALDGQNLNTFFADSAFQCRGQFLFCWFENGEVLDCCSDDSPIKVKRHLLHSGPCFEFQAAGIRQRLPGPVGGFGFAYWYPNAHILPTAFNSYDEHALHLYMSAADAMLEKHPIVLPVGYHNHISLTATHIKRIQKNEFGKKVCKIPTLKYFDDYTYPQCQVECLIDAMLLHCNCTGLATIGKIPQDKLCTPSQGLACYRNLASEFTNLLVECRQKRCEEACNYWVYGASLTVGKVFNPIIAEQMLKYWRLPEGPPGQSLILGDVYFDEIQFTDIEQHSAFNIETFVSSIGGAMGLWTGASIITWIHLLFFCCSSVCSCKKKKKATELDVEGGITEEKYMAQYCT